MRPGVMWPIPTLRIGSTDEELVGRIYGVVLRKSVGNTIVTAEPGVGNVDPGGGNDAGVRIAEPGRTLLYLHVHVPANLILKADQIIPVWIDSYLH